MFDSLRGTPATGYAPSTEVEGELGGLAFNRGWANSDGTALVPHPALQAGQQFAAALQGGGSQAPGARRCSAGITPPGAQPLARRPLADDRDA